MGEEREEDRGVEGETKLRVMQQLGLEEEAAENRSY